MRYNAFLKADFFEKLKILNYETTSVGEFAFFIYRYKTENAEFKFEMHHLNNELKKLGCLKLRTEEKEN